MQRSKSKHGAHTIILMNTIKLPEGATVVFFHVFIFLFVVVGIAIIASVVFYSLLFCYFRNWVLFCCGIFQWICMRSHLQSLSHPIFSPPPLYPVVHELGINNHQIIIKIKMKTPKKKKHYYYYAGDYGWCSLPPPATYVLHIRCWCT